ncbi:MAG: hypothetical protein OXN93_12810 [bacterium]|nr:hypothetical protein [bacterium]
MPDIETLGADYQGRVAVLAPAVQSSLDRAAGVAEMLLPSGLVPWGLDADQEVFSAYGFRGVPAGAIVASDGTLIDTWQGSRDIDEIEDALDDLLPMPDETAGRDTVS